MYVYDAWDYVRVCENFWHFDVQHEKMKINLIKSVTNYSNMFGTSHAHAVLSTATVKFHFINL